MNFYEEVNTLQEICKDFKKTKGWDMPNNFKRLVFVHLLI